MAFKATTAEANVTHAAATRVIGVADPTAKEATKVPGRIIEMANKGLKALRPAIKAEGLTVTLLGKGMTPTRIGQLIRMSREGATTPRAVTEVGLATTVVDIMTTEVDKISTEVDIMTTEADRITAEMDKTMTGENRVTTEVNKVSTEVDNSTTAVNKVSTVVDNGKTGMIRGITPKIGKTTENTGSLHKLINQEVVIRSRTEG